MKKQGRRGEGTIYKDEARGLWHGQMTLPNSKRRSVYGKTQREVQRKIAEIRREIEAGMYGMTGGEQSLRQFTDTWLMQRKHLRRRTYDGYVSLAKHHLDKLGEKSLAKITPTDIHAIYTEKLQAGLSSTTVHHIHELLHVVLKTAVKLGIVARNVTDFVDAPPLSPEEFTPLTESQVRVLLHTVKGDRLAALFMLVLSTGLRKGELLGLQWHNVDLVHGHVRIRTTLHRYAGAFVLEETKSRSSRRDLPLPPQTVLALKAHQQRQAIEKATIGASWDAAWNLVFCTPLGTPLDQRNPNRQLAKLVKMLKLPERLRIHDLRHTFATLLLERGVNIRVVSELLGHSSINITLATYSHVTPKMQDIALEQIAQIVDLTASAEED